MTLEDILENSEKIFQPISKFSAVIFASSDQTQQANIHHLIFSLVNRRMGGSTECLLNLIFCRGNFKRSIYVVIKTLSSFCRLFHRLFVNKTFNSHIVTLYSGYLLQVFTEVEVASGGYLPSRETAR